MLFLYLPEPFSIAKNSENLLNLGHLDLKANGLTEPEMPGDVNVEAVSLPAVQVGDRLVVISQP